MQYHWVNGQTVVSNGRTVYVDRPPMPDLSGNGIVYKPEILPPETAKKMVQVALMAVVDPKISSFARYLVRELADENYHPFASVYSEIQAVYNWVKGHVRYTRDPIGVELVYSPQMLLKLIEQYGSWSEDCDTQLLLMFTLLLALGRDVRMTIAGFDEPGIYTHVFIEVYMPPVPGYIPARWVVVDPSTDGKTLEMTRAIKTFLHFSP